jgi:hypothetical protein
MTNRAYAKNNGDGLLCSILCRMTEVLAPDIYRELSAEN